MDAIFVVTALKGTVVLAVAWLMTLVLRRRSAAARHLVWTAAAAAVIALPFLSMGLPALRLPAAVVDLSAASSVVFRVFATASADAPSLANGLPSAAQAANPGSGLPRLGQVVPPIWALGTAVLILQMLAAYGVMWRKRRAARRFDNPELDSPFEVLQGEPGSMPMTFGVIRPAIFLPADACEWPAERRRIVLLHEQAHARRGDVATHLLARTALSLHWWNPLAWIAWRQFVKERERAADDMVLQAGARASDYAAHLLEVARSMQLSPGTTAAAVAMARPSQLEGRLLAILDSRLNRGTLTGVASFAAAVLAIAAVAPFAALDAQTKPVPPEIDATIRAAIAQKNHQILDQAARAYEDIQKFEVAQSLLEAALPIRAEVSGQQSAAYAAGLVKLGDVAVMRRQPAEAEAFYTKALAGGDRPEVVPALMFLGLKAFRDKDRDAAADWFQRAYNADPKGPKAGTALRWMAVMRQYQPDRIGEAESLYQRALAVEDPNSFEAATTQELYAIFLRQQSREIEAAPIAARAQEIRRARASEQVRAGVQGSEVGSSPGTFRVGGDVSAPRLEYKVEPQYSEEARAAKYQGTVLLYIEVGVDGRAHNIRVARSLGLGLDEKAIEAVRQWLFMPGQKKGAAVQVAATIEVNFRLM